MSCHDDISFPPCHGSLSTGPQHPGVRHHCDEPVDVSAQVDLDQVPLSQHRVWFTEQGGVVADDVVDGDAGGEGHS